MEKIKTRVNETLTTGKRVINNAEQFVQATALAVLAGFSFWTLHKIPVAEPLAWVVTGAIAITTLRAFVEYVKFLDKE